MAKKFILTIVGVIIVVGFIVGTKVIQIRTMVAAAANATPPIEIVTSAPVHEDSWESIINVPGSLAAVQGVTVSAELAGKVTKIE